LSILFTLSYYVDSVSRFVRVGSVAVLRLFTHLRGSKTFYTSATTKRIWGLLIWRFTNALTIILL